ncbi:DUF456 domain-containing protein [Flavobacteriales bacterium]|nr:DUF456 domain-containing protein [Flavobacteriales bacterium]
MGTLILVISFLFMLLGLFGAILPIIPGPIMSYIGLLLIYFFADFNFSGTEVLVCGVITGLVLGSDYIFQFLGIKQSGGQTKAIYGTIFGILIGLFFLPIGLVFGPFLGAFLGALWEKKEKKQAIQIALGALVGFIFGTFIKLIYAVLIILFVISKI